MHQNLKRAARISHLTDSNQINLSDQGIRAGGKRRLVLAVATLAVAGMQFMLPATTLAQSVSAVPGIAAKASQALPSQTLPSFTAIKQVNAGDLNVGYVEEGPANGPVVILLHGWPYDINSFIDVVPMLTKAGYRVIVPHLRGYGTTRFLDPNALRNGEPAALASDVVALMDALKIDKAVLAGYDWGARTAGIVAALWPERVKALVAVSGYLIGSQEAGKQALPPTAELQWWYQFYFATERGRAGYDKNRHDFAKLIWQTASPQWRFDDATFDRSAVALDNPDHVAITVHNYRWRLGLANGETKYEALEAKLASFPAITVPSITMEGDANGAPHPDPVSYAKRFTGKYRHVLISGGIGHNLPQEAPRAFADAVISADHL
jgi:pimeloyl-ACP methyl ester carboxylesterase